MSVLEKKLKQAIKSGKKIVCAFLTLGFPDLSLTEKLIEKLEKSGVDLVELGIPFSDPLADGPTIQASSDYALKHGARFEDAYKVVKSLRKKKVGVPIVLFSYTNPILYRGMSSVAKELKKSGFQGAVIPDLPPDEARETEKLFQKNRLDLVHLIAPTTEKSRAQMVARRSKGFIYYVSLKGVTGARKSLPEDIASSVKTIRRKFKKPVLVGFGISSPEQVRKICKFSDGVIIGSALVERLRKTNFSVKKTAAFAKSLVRAAKT